MTATVPGSSRSFIWVRARVYCRVLPHSRAFTQSHARCSHATAPIFRSLAYLFSAHGVHRAIAPALMAGGGAVPGRDALIGVDAHLERVDSASRRCADARAGRKASALKRAHACQRHTDGFIQRGHISPVRLSQPRANRDNNNTGQRADSMALPPGWGRPAEQTRTINN